VTVTTTSAERPVAVPAASATRRLPPTWLVVSGLTTALIVFCTGRGLARGYEPIGDNAMIELRAWDVFSRDFPLLGSGSSASLSAGRDVNHPGPLLFEYLAIPVRLLGGPVGLAVGAAVLNIAALWGSVLVARRVDGDRTAAGVGVAAAVLAWTMGSELLYDVWQPNILVLPFFCFLVLMWVVFAGRSRALPFAVAVGSLCMQAHISYVVLVPALLVAGVVALAVHDRGQTWTRHRGSLLISVGVGIVLWAPPLWEQFSGAGEGNISRLIGSTGADENPRHGFALGVRILGAVLAVPRGWLRPGFDTAVPIAPWVEDADGRRLDLGGFPSVVTALFWLVLAAAVIVALVVLTRRAGQTFTSYGALVAAVTASVGLISLAITPVDHFGVSPHRMRWLWALGAFLLAVVLAAVLNLVAARFTQTALATWVVTVVAALVTVVATLPTYAAESGPVDQRQYGPLVQSVRSSLDPVKEAGGTVLFDNTGLVFAEPYSWPVLAELARSGIEFEVETESISRHVGRRRLADGDAKWRMFFRFGEDVTLAPPGATLVVVADDPENRYDVALFMEPYSASSEAD
jgi:hypothetical protein